MSNFNASQDYRGITITSNEALPDPFEEINVKTLNIVDNNNSPYYTMPEQPVLTNNSVAVFNIDGSSSLTPLTQYPTTPSCFGWQDSGAGDIPINALTVQLIPSFVTTPGLIPNYNNPISSFSYNQVTGTITCNEAGIYLIQQSYSVTNPQTPTQFGWTIGLRNVTSGKFYKCSGKTPRFSDPNEGQEFSYSSATYDTFTAPTELTFFGSNSDPVNTVGYKGIYITIFRVG